MDKLTVIFGIYGESFSQNFLISWTQAIYSLLKTNRYEILMCNGTTRLETLGANVLLGKSQKPYNDKKYDVFVSIDSTTIFSADQLIELIECTKLHPVVAGYYHMRNFYSAIKDWNKTYFLENGHFEHMGKELEPYIDRFKKALEENKEGKEELPQPEFMPVCYADLGFFACRKEVMDNLQYPYFQYENQTFRKDGVAIVAVWTAEMAFCKNVEEAGYDIMLNTRLRVGSEKKMVI